ncbi:MAG: nuclease [Acidobacteriaceae bacterium]
MKHARISLSAGPSVLVLGALMLVPVCEAQTQQPPIGRIVVESGKTAGSAGAQEVKVTGAVTINKDQLLLGNGSGVAASVDPVKIALTRGGEIHLCSLSSLHLSASGTGTTSALMLALDKGAVEVQMPAATASDILLTPDLRFQLNHAEVKAAPLDLRVRVNNSGDTCVENRGKHAPVLTLTEQFGNASYDVLPGQHVLFEHGSLAEVVDNEPSPCGCPPALGASLTKGQAGSKEAEHPFPLAVSEGLAPPPEPPPSKPGETQMQITMPMTYSGDAPAGTADSASMAGSDAESAPQAAAPPKPKRGFFHSIGHFFKRMFGGK